MAHLEATVAVAALRRNCLRFMGALRNPGLFPIYSIFKNLMQTGCPTSSVFPEAVSLPVFWSIRKTTMLFDS